MNDERHYGLEDGYSDGSNRRAPQVRLDLVDGGEYDLAYVEGYQRANAEGDGADSHPAAGDA